MFEEKVEVVGELKSSLVSKMKSLIENIFVATTAELWQFGDVRTSIIMF